MNNKLKEYLGELNLTTKEMGIARDIANGFYELFLEGGVQELSPVQATVIGNLIKTSIGVTLAVRDENG